MSNDAAMAIEDDDGDEMPFIPVPPAEFDVLLRSARFAAQIIMAADEQDSLSSAKVRAVARANGLANDRLYTSEMEDVVMGFTADEDQAESDEDGQVAETVQ